MSTSQEQITLEAAEWLLRLEEDPDAAGQARFVDWLKLSPRHMDEFLMVEASYRTVSQADADHRLDLEKLVTEARAGIVPLREDAGAPPAAMISRPTLPHGQRFRRLAYAAAAAMTVGTALFVFHLLRGEVYSTGIGEQTAFRLADGSLLHLNTGSSARVRFTDGGREVELTQGEAFFTVRQDAGRPFRVRAGDATVDVLGTRFNVYRRTAEHLRVSVLDGRVKVASQPLGAGEEADVVGSDEVTVVTHPDVAAATAWRQRRLVFRMTPLAEVAAEFNRYNTELRLQLTGDALARRRITGTFNADEPQTLLKFLRQDPTVRLDTRNGIVTLRAIPR